MSTQNDDDMSTEPLFVTIKDDFVIEKNFTGKVGNENTKQDFLLCLPTKIRFPIGGQRVWICI